MGVMQPIHVLRAQKKKYKILNIAAESLFVKEQEMIANQKAKEAQPKPPPDMREYVQIDKIFPLLTPMEQSQVIMQFNIKPDPRRQLLPPQALGGEPPAQGDNGSQQHELMMGQQEHKQKMVQGGQAHAQKMRQASETHKLKVIQQALKIRQSMQQPKSVQQ